MHSLHGAIVYTVNGIIGQVQGIPSPPGYITYLPKYRLCDLATPWRGHGYSLCREIPHYGPLGLASAMRRLKGGWRIDPLYGIVMPYASEYEIMKIIDPRTAVKRLVSEGSIDPRPLETLYTIRREAGVGLDDLGVTGSYAIGIIHPGSDLDIIVYDDSALRLYEYFLSIREGPSREYLGGVVLEPYVDLSWRRARLGGLSVTWTGVPQYWHCPPLENYFAITPPLGIIEKVLYIEPYQIGALLYPPCVRAGDYWLVSYEYNLGGPLYEGGVVKVRAISGGDTIFIGTREYPGRIRLSGREG